MDPEIEKILNKAKEIKMTSRERNFIRENLISYSQNNVPTVNFEAKQSSPYFNNFHFTFAYKLAIIVLLVATSSGGLISAAGGSLPGNFLYPIKVNVTEKIVKSFIKGSDAKIAFQQKLVERRLDEISTLIDSGETSDTAVSQAEAYLTRETKAISDEIEKYLK